MADDKKADAGAEGAKGGKKKKMMMIIIIAAILALAGGGGGYFYMQKQKAAAELAKKKKKKKKAAEELAATDEGQADEGDDAEGGDEAADSEHEAEAGDESGGDEADGAEHADDEEVDAEEEAAAAEEGGGEHGEGGGESAYLSLAPAFVVNFRPGPNGEKPRAKFMSVEIEVLPANPAVSEKIKGNMPLVRNAVIMLLSEKTYDELVTPEGKEELRKEMIAKMQAVLKKPTKKKKAVQDIFFTSFVMQ